MRKLLAGLECEGKAEVWCEYWGSVRSFSDNHSGEGSHVVVFDVARTVSRGVQRLCMIERRASLLI